MVLWQPRKKDIVHKIFMSERAIPFTTCLSCTCAWVIHSRDSCTLAYYYRTHTNSHTNVHTQSLTYIQTKLNSGCQHTHMQIDTHYIYAHAHAHTHIHTHTHTCTHIHTHTGWRVCHSNSLEKRFVWLSVGGGHHVFFVFFIYPLWSF